MKKLSPVVYHKKKANIPFTIAHRGACSIVPENTLEAFSIAIAQNSDFVEMDVIYTKDRQQIVFHDPSLGRVTNAHSFPEFVSREENRYVDFLGKEIMEIWADKLTLEEIRKLRVQQTIGPLSGGRTKIFDLKFSIPTLDETIELFLKQNKEKKELQISQKKSVQLTGLNIEIKQPQMYREVFEPEFNHAAEILKTLKKYQLDDPQFAADNLPIIISSFDQISIKYFKEQTLLPCFQLTNAIYSYTLEDISSYADGVCVDLKLVIDKETLKSTGFIEKAHSLDLQVFGYTVKDDDLPFANNYFATYDLLQNILKIDGIFAEFPEKAKAIFQAYDLREQGLSFEDLNADIDETKFFTCKKVKQISAQIEKIDDNKEQPKKEGKIQEKNDTSNKQNCNKKFDNLKNQTKKPEIKKQEIKKLDTKKPEIKKPEIKKLGNQKIISKISDKSSKIATKNNQGNKKVTSKAGIIATSSLKKK